MQELGRRREHAANFLSQVSRNVAAVIGFQHPEKPHPVQPHKVLNGSTVYLLPGQGRCTVALRILSRTAPSPSPNVEAVLCNFDLRASFPLCSPHPTPTAFSPTTAHAKP